MTLPTRPGLDDARRCHPLGAQQHRAADSRGIRVRSQPFSVVRGSTSGTPPTRVCSPGWSHRPQLGQGFEQVPASTLISALPYVGGGLPEAAPVFLGSRPRNVSGLLFPQDGDFRAEMRPGRAARLARPMPAPPSGHQRRRGRVRRTSSVGGYGHDRI